jgi:signal transduction histidine kinase
LGAAVVVTTLLSCTMAAAALRYGRSRFDLQAIAVTVLAASLAAGVTMVHGLPASTPITLQAVAAASAVVFVARFPGRGRASPTLIVMAGIVVLAALVGAAVAHRFAGWITVGVMGLAALLTLAFAAVRFRSTSHPRGASLQLVATTTLAAGLSLHAVLPAGAITGWAAIDTAWVPIALVVASGVACTAALAYALVGPSTALLDHVAWVSVPAVLVGATAFWIAPEAGVLVAVVCAVAVATVVGLVGRAPDPVVGMRIDEDAGLPRRTRETLVALDQLTDPLAVQERVVEALTNLVPGAQLELFRARTAPDGAVEKAREAKTLLVQAAARHGALVGHQMDELTEDERAAFVEIGVDLIVPVQAGPVLYGLLAVRASGLDRAGIAQARRFADLLALKLETHRLYSELETQKRLASLGTLTAALAHDLRNPLSAIRLNLQMLGHHRGMLGADAECIDLALGEVDRLNAELETLLDFSRPVTLDADAFAPQVLAAEATHQVAGRFAERGVVLRTEAAESLPMLRGDVRRLARVLANLLDNASAASKPGSTVVLRIVGGGDRIRLSVEDRGSGIAEEDLPRLFDPFFTRRVDGTGLGLAIARKIVRAHRGQLTVKSTLGRGSTFTVELPVGA